MSNAPALTSPPLNPLEPVVRPPRVVAVDALRGFDMFWLIGGAAIVRALPAAEGSWVKGLQAQFQHMKWEGFTFYDLIFPLFLFLIGCSVPIAFTNRRARGERDASLYRHIGIRAALMVLIGMTINGNLLTFDPAKFQISYSVLQMLAYGYVVAAVLYLNFSLRVRIAWFCSSLLLYWALETFVRVPGHEIGVYAPGKNFGDWFNNLVLGDWQGRWRSGWIVQGALAHSATAMLGVFAGEIFQRSWTPERKLKLFIGLGFATLLAGWLWSFQYPIIKVRWSSTYVLFAGGWSFLLLALFYWVIDIRGVRRLVFPLVVIGANSLLAYIIAEHFKPSFTHVSTRLLGGLARYCGDWGPAFLAAGSTAAIWLFLYWLYRTKAFLRI